MFHLFCNALVHVIYSVVSGQYSYTRSGVNLFLNTGLNRGTLVIASIKRVFIQSVSRYELNVMVYCSSK